MPSASSAHYRTTAPDKPVLTGKPEEPDPIKRLFNVFSSMPKPSSRPLTIVSSMKILASVLTMIYRRLLLPITNCKSRHTQYNNISDFCYIATIAQTYFLSCRQRPCHVSSYHLPWGSRSLTSYHIRTGTRLRPLIEMGQQARSCFVPHYRHGIIHCLFLILR